MIISPTAISPYKIPTYQSGGGAPPFSFDNALKFDGVNDFVNLSSVFFGNRTTFTANTWFKFASIGSTRKYIIDEGTSGSYGTAIALNFGTTGKLGARCRNSGTEVQLESTTTILADTWYFVSFVFDSITDNHYLYIDGSLEDSSTVSSGAANPNAALYLGDEAQLLRFGANVTLDEISLFAEPLSLANHQLLYNLGNGNLATDISPNPINYYQCNEADGEITLIDTMGVNNGALINFSTPPAYFIPH